MPDCLPKIVHIRTCKNTRDRSGTRPDHQTCHGSDTYNESMTCPRVLGIVIRDVQFGACIALGFFIPELNV